MPLLVPLSEWVAVFTETLLVLYSCVGERDRGLSFWFIDLKAKGNPVWACWSLYWMK